MAVFENSIEILAPPEFVFDLLSDQRSELEWNPGVVRMDKITDGPVGVGTRFKAKWKNSPNLTTEIIEYDRPHGWRYRNGGPLAVDLTLSLSPTSHGCRVTARFDVTPHGPVRLFFPLIRGRLEREEASLGKLYKAYVEERWRTQSARQSEQA